MVSFLAALAPVGLVAGGDLQDLDPGLVQVAHQPGTGGTQALDTTTRATSPWERIQRSRAR